MEIYYWASLRATFIPPLLLTIWVANFICSMLRKLEKSNGTLHFDLWPIMAAILWSYNFFVTDSKLLVIFVSYLENNCILLFVLENITPLLPSFYIAAFASNLRYLLKYFIFEGLYKYLNSYLVHICILRFSKLWSITSVMQCICFKLFSWSCLYLLFFSVMFQGFQLCSAFDWNRLHHKFIIHLWRIITLYE